MEVIGYLGRDAAVSDVDGMCAINFSVAHTEKFKKDNVQHEKTTWVECTIWRKPDAVNVASYLKKGVMVYVDGKPDARAYKAKVGDAIHGVMILRVDKIVFLSKAGAVNEQASETTVTAPAPTDDLPF